MARNISVEALDAPPIESQNVEMVERKGIGHPDSIADGIAESVSRALSNMYIVRHGRILHHNTDQVEVVGGESVADYRKKNGGEVIKPVYILISGRATTEVVLKGCTKDRVPYQATAIQAARQYLADTCTNLNLETDVMLDCKIGHGSVDLVENFNAASVAKKPANDTSFGVGYAPFSDVENLVFETEKFINGKLNRKMKAVGQDIKVMGMRRGDSISLTVAAAMVGKHLDDWDDYVDTRAALKEQVLANAKKLTRRKVAVDVNTADIDRDRQGYLTVTGLSMENGDDGSVGRGNRANGLITPFRPMSMEATSGKNPVTHTGKLYNVLAIKTANRIIAEMGDCIEEAHVHVLSQIGKTIDQPHMASVKLVPKGCKVTDIRRDVAAIMDDELAHVFDLTMGFAQGKFRTF